MVNLNLQRINSEAPYQLSPTKFGGLSYRFITDYKVVYNIGFMPDELFPYDFSYQFVIVNSNNLKSPRDLKLKQTILTFLFEFFRNPEVVLVYMCDTSDQRQRMRSRLFESWFKSSPRQNDFLLLSTQVSDEEGIMNYAAVITRKDNPHRTQIYEEFNKNVEMFRNKPQ